MIDIRGLCKRYGSTEILSEVSLSVEKGQVAAIIGPSGGGKSTLLRCINGLETFEGGEIQVAGSTLSAAHSPAERQTALRTIRRRVGFVFQQFHLFPHLSAVENIIEAPVHVLGKKRDEAIADADVLLARVGMTHRRTAYPARLSGGEQQRVAIARALAMKPEVLLLDEPTSALDPSMASEVAQVISDLAKSGQTMVLVTHQMGLARAIADTVHVFAAGRRAEFGPPSVVFENPQHAVTRSFLEKLAMG
jgi:ABC-type polar amino acid transport system ATPase subunit